MPARNNQRLQSRGTPIRMAASQLVGLQDTGGCTLQDVVLSERLVGHDDEMWRLEYPLMIWSKASTYSEATRRMRVMGAHIQERYGVPLHRMSTTLE